VARHQTEADEGKKAAFREAFAANVGGGDAPKD
jgi:hypothetical protein